MRLIEEDVPATMKVEPKYARYVPLVTEFLRSGMESARVELEDGDEAQDVVPARLKCAISNMKESGKVRVAVRSGNAYLARK